MSIQRYVDGGFYVSEIFLLAEYAGMLDRFPEFKDDPPMTSGSCWTELITANCINNDLGGYQATKFGKEILNYLINNPYKFDKSGYVRVINLEKYTNYFET